MPLTLPAGTQAGDADFAASEVRLIRHSGELVYWGRWGDRLIDGFWRPRDIDWSTYSPPVPAAPVLFPDHAPDCLKQKGAMVSPSGAAQTFIRCTYGKEPAASVAKAPRPRLCPIGDCPLDAGHSGECWTSEPEPGGRAEAGEPHQIFNVDVVDVDSAKLATRYASTKNMLTFHGDEEMRHRAALHDIFDAGHKRGRSDEATVREAEISRLKGLLDRDQTGLAAALGAVVKACDGSAWIAEGRGCYEWDDDQYREETRHFIARVYDIAKPALQRSGSLANAAFNPKRSEPVKTFAELEAEVAGRIEAYERFVEWLDVNHWRLDGAEKDRLAQLRRELAGKGA